MKNSKTYTTTLPDFIEIQRKSFCWFLSQGLSAEFQTFGSIVDMSDNLEICFFNQEYILVKPLYSALESKHYDTSYSARIQMYLQVRDKKANKILLNRKIFLGYLPLMTDVATFIINGCERIIVSQIIRSPGIYFQKTKRKTPYTKYQDKRDAKFSFDFYSATLIPDRGSWVKFEFNRDQPKNQAEEMISEILRLKNRTGDDIVVDINRNVKYSLISILQTMGLSDKEIIKNLQYPNYIYLNNYIYSNLENTQRLPITNQALSSAPNNNLKSYGLYSEFYQIFDERYYFLGKIGRYKINKRLNLKISEQFQTLTYQDIFSIIDYLITLSNSNAISDDIDHLKNRKVRSVGELIQNQFRVGLQRLKRKGQETLVFNSLLKFNTNTLINSKLLIATLKEFFGSSQLSQYMDQTNPLSALTHKRRISSLGPGGLNRDRISFAMRDIHPSHYGRICPIETPEGQNAGLVASLTTCAGINDLGFLVTPFWRVINGKVLKKGNPIYLTAEEEDNYKIAPADIYMDENDYLVKDLIPVRYQQDFRAVRPAEVDFIAISPVQVVSPGAALIPFLEHDDANRALMGSNMQRQAVPLLLAQKPIVGTGLENQIAVDSGMAVTSLQNGVVKYVSADKIIIQDYEEKQYTYNLQKYDRSNQETCINHKPIVWVGEKIESGQIIADGPGIDSGELALGQNILVAYMPWQGYNFEDAILINERLIYDDVFTSIHIEKYEIDVIQTKEGNEKITRNIPNIEPNHLQYLDENGIIYKGSFVKPGDILVGKVTPKSDAEQLPEAKLLRAIFGAKAKGVRDTSFRMPEGEYGRVIETLTFNRRTKLAYKFEKIQIFIAQIRKIQVGDKIAGRHGNKGIISRILPRQDMPFLPDGTPVDIILNPLGVPSRMNVGQLYECLLGFAGHKLERRFKILPFDEMYGPEVSRILINKKLRQAAIEKDEAWVFNPYSPGKMVLVDGRTGKEFENPITVGSGYMLKLIHLVDDKMHARATGPYSLVTQQPLGGKAQQGGQRFGEMEVWALEGFGAAFTLKELLTIKSDDMEGRNETLNAIVKGQSIPTSGIPESFKVLLQELRSIGLDMSTYRIEQFNTSQTYETEVNLIEKYDPLSKTFPPTSNTNSIAF